MLGYEHLTPGAPRARGPSPTVYCYICGRQFGSKSIGIHQPQCLKKWEVQNAKLPKAQRRPPPVPPEVIRKGDAIDFEATNQAAYECSLGQLAPCEHCGRKFGADRLAVHQRSCTKERPAKRVEDMPKGGHQPQLATSTAAARQRQKAKQQHGGA